MASTADLLFNYLRDIIYQPDKAQLNIADLDDEYKRVGEGLVFLEQQLREQRLFARALSNGDLSADLPSRGNELAAPLKSLHASLRHLTWQTQQVADGDYRQKVDFMGEFSDAFNRMIEQLDSRQVALETEIALSRDKSKALERSNKLLSKITAGIPQCIAVLSDDTGKLLFTNPAAQMLLDGDDTALPALMARRKSEQSESDEIAAVTDGETVFYSVSSYAVHWSGKDATAFVLRDISADKRYMTELEHHATVDSLTGAMNRYAGMNVLYQWMQAERKFVLGFADLDNLKYVNDQLGHSEGDLYIIRVARVLAGFSPAAVVSRIGGDEFMILVPDIEEKQALERLAELRTEVIEGIAADGCRYSGSISYGVAQNAPGLEPSELLGIADERMYRFKRQSKLLARQQLENTSFPGK
ncbi:diguanylate cyclase [Ruminococcaceae bacterium OttesenSCG-928-L11]|nr:diguanylate cyclase [Ruminococcaceae bacterium OttesenSCG-928-L11]